MCACMEHWCHDCGQVWFDNFSGGHCPKCCGHNCGHTFDEIPDRDDDREDEREADDV